MKQVGPKEPEPREQCYPKHRHDNRLLGSLLLDEGIPETGKRVETRRARGKVVEPAFAVLKCESFTSENEILKDPRARASLSFWIRELCRKYLFASLQQDLFFVRRKRDLVVLEPLHRIALLTVFRSPLYSAFC